MGDKSAFTVKPFKDLVSANHELGNAAFRYKGGPDYPD
jgi:hypothetical protein